MKTHHKAAELQCISLSIATPILLAFTLLLTTPVSADPCGMVPPIYVQPDQQGIVRDGLQKTYVFYKDGVESLVIHPGFKGDVQEFGMLIPFPSPPAIRKVPDNTFAHIANTIDPPEVVVDIRPMQTLAFMARESLEESRDESAGAGLGISQSTVQVLREEAVGMYDVAVLKSGSADDLKRWMTENEYRFPQGMESVCEDYIKDDWCFVAVRASVGHKQLVDPQPGATSVDSTLQPGASFDGHVQAMGFRFFSDKLTVPMRLSTYNDGDLRNVVYLLTDQPMSIHKIPSDFVVRQLAGSQLLKNATSPLPLRVLGGTASDIPESMRAGVIAQRNSRPRMLSAADLFRGDLLAAKRVKMGGGRQETAWLTSSDEVRIKQMSSISEALGLRDVTMDALHREAAIKTHQSAEAAALSDLKLMTLTVIDGDFPREVLAAENLEFETHRMPAKRNSSAIYNARTFGVTNVSMSGNVHFGMLPGQQDASGTNTSATTPLSLLPNAESESTKSRRHVWTWGIALAMSLAIGCALIGRRLSNRKNLLASWLLVALTLTTIGAEGTKVSDAAVNQLLQELSQPTKARVAVKHLVELGDRVVEDLAHVAAASDDTVARGWAIVCLGSIDTPLAEETIDTYSGEPASPLLSMWWQAARVMNCDTIQDVRNAARKSQLNAAIARPIGLKLNSLMQQSDNSLQSLEAILDVIATNPSSMQVLLMAVTESPADRLVDVMLAANSNEARRYAASCLATKVTQGDKQIGVALNLALAFDSEAKEVPWHHGALFLPWSAGSQTEARELLKNLIAWFMWCHENEKPTEANQIRNNLPNVAATAGVQIRSYTLDGLIEALGFSQTPKQLLKFANSVGYEIAEPVRREIEQGSNESKRVLIRQARQVRPAWVIETESAKGDKEQRKRVLTLHGGIRIWWLGSDQIFDIENARDAERLASVGGKYSEMLQRVDAPEDLSSYGYFSDYGHWVSPPGYRGHAQLPTGYWVYVAPHWYIWKTVRDK